SFSSSANLSLHSFPTRRSSDLGPSLEYNFLVFNLNDLSAKKLETVSGKQAWFRDLKFRQAVSAAIDRDSIVRLVYGSRGTALWGDRKSTRLNSSHQIISYAVFC